MPKYTVPVTRKTLDVYVVEARNATEAGMNAAYLIAENAPPTHQRELSRVVGTARPEQVEPHAVTLAK
jgi:hypothetical protein